MKKNMSQYRWVLILTFLFIIISLYNYHRLGGIHSVSDSPRYLKYAQNLKQGFYLEPHNQWYISYVFFIFLVKLFTNSIIAICIAQVIISYFALIVLFKSSYLLFEDITSAYITSFLYLFFIEINDWNYYILAESMYSSLTCFSIFFLVKLYKKGFKRYEWILAFFVFVLTILTKPTGFVLLIILIITLLFYLNKTYSPSKSVKLLSLLVASLSLLFMAEKILATYNWVNQNYVRGDIVYGITYYSHLKTKYSMLYITPPENLQLPNDSIPETLRILIFIIKHPLYWFQLFFYKFFYFIFHIRPFWSIQHNIYSFTILSLSYIAFSYTLFKKRLSKLFTFIVLTYVILHTLIVCFSTIDWDGRFLIPIIPIVFLIASYSFSQLLKKLFKFTE